MQTKRTEIEARLQRNARRLLDELGDGLQLTMTGYQAFRLLSESFRDLDDLGPTPIHGDDHPANALGPDTQHHAAATTAMLRSRTRRDVVVQLLLTRRQPWAVGLSCQILEGRLRAEHTTVSSAVNWLLNHGWIEDSGNRKKNRSGRPAIVWQLTPAAIEATKGGLP